MTRQISILDSTLREGEQFHGICFSADEKIQIAKKLIQFGVDVIEIGHPGISEIETNICKAICDSLPEGEFLVHSRACEPDILAAQQTGAKWIGIWASYNDISLETKFRNKNREWIQNQVKSAIQFAKKCGFKVRFSIEDASRTEQALVYELGKVACVAGADRITLADTVGVWHPRECAEMVKFAVENFDSEIEVHLHNDLGLAQANAIAAIDAGASIVDTSILGIGERAGICDLFALSACLKRFYHLDKYNLDLSADLAKAINKISKFNTEPHHPIVGRNVFTHVSKYHAKAAEKKPESYEGLNPEDFGAKRKILINKLDRQESNRLSKELDVKRPFIKGASELLHHRDGVGNRWVFMDNRVDARSPVYIIERIFDKNYEQITTPHVDSHAHNCDSTFVFMGNNADGTGLTVTVTFGEGSAQKTELIESPASVFIPMHVFHSYAYVKGTGRFLNFVLSPNYNESILI